MGRVIGMSWLGNSCRRFIWLKFREAFKQDVSPELQKVFDDGNRIESEVVSDLKTAGNKVTDRDESTGKQLWVTDPKSNFIGGFLDGLIEHDGMEMVLEIKSANAKNFAKIKRFGMCKAKPVYWTQLNCYLGLTGHSHGLWVVRNKETGETYEEVLPFDLVKFTKDINKARAIVDAPDVLEPNHEFFNCKFCDARDVCFGNRLPEISCKTCRFYQISNDMRYPRCNKHLDHRTHREPCDDFVYTNNVLDMAGFNFEDEDTFWNYKEGCLEGCVLLIRDEFGHEYPLRGIEDCNELKAKMAQGWHPDARLTPRK